MKMGSGRFFLKWSFFFGSGRLFLEKRSWQKLVPTEFPGTSSSAAKNEFAELADSQSCPGSAGCWQTDGRTGLVSAGMGKNS